jgi:hypothetical protein
LWRGRSVALTELAGWRLPQRFGEYRPEMLVPLR